MAATPLPRSLLPDASTFSSPHSNSIPHPDLKLTISISPQSTPSFDPSTFSYRHLPLVVQLYAEPTMLQYLRETMGKDIANAVIVSPDAGGAKR